MHAVPALVQFGLCFHVLLLFGHQLQRWPRLSCVQCEILAKVAFPSVFLRWSHLASPEELASQPLVSLTEEGRVGVATDRHVRTDRLRPFSKGISTKAIVLRCA